MIYGNQLEMNYAKIVSRLILSGKKKEEIGKQDYVN